MIFAIKCKSLLEELYLMILIQHLSELLALILSFSQTNLPGYGSVKISSLRHYFARKTYEVRLTSSWF